ncbi:Ig-like protein group 2 [Mobilisporobacter senegalensis]|uniref:Ig-like protein group 2 n=1 Tax=Mobilisporobacter senegalensis TaxID=1329262 RepID=A0A3N1XCW7_9FIRM|nr:family 16 glycosylhydrolase [Mobilisporobacter senegalensis]ROR23878.1 Ig-like protein group 2 [Mobilisporobacter senegalensis]
MKATEKGLKRRILSLVLVMVMVLGSVSFLAPNGIKKVKAAEATITSMAYFSPADGPIISKSGVSEASYGFVMPIFNGGGASWQEVANDLTVNVKVNGTWVNIDNTDFVYNVNWGNWSDSGFNGYWFKVSETTYIRLASKSSGVTLDYTLEFTNIPTTTITSMTPTQGPVLTAGVTGSIGFTYPVFNGNPSIPYNAVANDLKVYVKEIGSSEWIDIDNNAPSGWIYDRNFGQFTDGGGGYWFVVDKSINVKLESVSSKVSLIYTINYSEPVRNSYIISAYDGTSYTAGEAGEIGIPLPKIDGGAPTKSELDNFVYQIKVNGEWVELSDYSKSSFSYSGNGYNKMSAANQWGYWVDYIYGLWFQPIQVDMEIRIGYPMNGIKGGNINSNYVYYTFTGNPDAVRPDVSDLGNIELGTSEDSYIPGNELIWNDEFSGTALNMNHWSYNTGYYINDDPGTWGWGNNEMEHYTDNERNVFVRDGNLNIVAYEEPKSFPQDPNRYAQYSSGKITTKDKFTFKYGRIDFRAKLPTGNGMWPALWMLPNDDTYGTWAASGELDVMEARGRLPGSTSGTIHFGGQWPANTYMGADYLFPEGQTFASDYHVYSVVWEEESIKWYVDGKCFSKITSDQWYSTGAPNDENAPFDQEFYIIMNLAVGGWFDGGITPNPSDLPGKMQVDYVRVYKPTGNEEPGNVPVTGMTLDKQTVTLTSIGQTTLINKSITPGNATNKNVTWESSNPGVATVSAGQVTAVSNGTTTIKATTQDGGYSATCVVTVNANQSDTVIIGNDIRGLKKTGDKIEFYVNGATFADIHYKINNGPQQNVAMTSIGNSNYRYTVNNLNYEDTIEYFFTYNPGNGALDTETFTYIHGVTQGTEEETPGGNDTYVEVAAGKTVTSSGVENDTLAAGNLNDKNMGTRWASNFSDDAWFIIDLGDSYDINRMVLNWEAAYGKQYEIFVSGDGRNYSSVKRQTNGTGGIETINFNAENVRFVKFQGIERALPYGYSLYEVEVYGK